MNGQQEISIKKIAYLTVYSALFLLRTTYLSTFGFLLIFIFAASLCMCGDAHGNRFYRSVLLSSFSVWIVAVLVLLLISDADGFEPDLPLDLDPDSPRDSRISEAV